ncbi:cation diffusion facilitator family transporter [Romboutsia lituseburensis]|uniref:cation diffusion facilitator family transporter n=1 Tax=Romboutsia lituseburensis TaxID=1537 RepID=UPI00215B14F3|nr:cation diffusion facilitator family transporter [Romboutsia lituseburensis]MCR8747138.1 cation diffusion facilitator family transporter [Romboutsia lituseburensis]
MENTNYKKVKQVLLIILFANLGVALLKIIIGNSIKSASMTADGFHSISDGTSNIVGLIGIALASKPIDKEHPYGHNKFEVISGLFIGGMLLFLGFKIIIDAVMRFKNPVTPTITMVSLIVLLVTLLINILVCTYEYRIGKKLNSYILVSDSLHTKSDIFVSIGVLMTLVGVKLGLPAIIDPIASLVVAGFILHASYEVFKSTIDVLVDTAIIDEDDIREVLKKFKTIKSVHEIRSRGSESNVHIDMHIMVDPNLTVEDSHVLNHDIEDLIREKINKSAQVIVHTEPYYE